MSQEYDLPSSADHCDAEACGFNQAVKSDDPNVLADEGATVALAVDGKRSNPEIAHEMRRTLSETQIFQGFSCASCILNNMCGKFKAAENEQAAGHTVIVKL